MKDTVKSPSLWFGYDVISEMGPFPRPQRIEFWKDKDFEALAPESPFHYKADALLGLALYHLHPKWKSAHLPEKASRHTQDLWQTMEPHYELYLRAQHRVQALRAQMKNAKTIDGSSFARSLTEVVAHAGKSWGWDFSELAQLTESIDHLEAEAGRPLLYDFTLQFEPETRQKLHWLHSALFHLRTLIAMDHNAYVQDATHEAIRVDSITDYLARSEYVANDALLYWTFKKIRSALPDQPAATLENAFLSYSHNGAYLIESLPKSFLNGLNNQDLEESLYLVQMDWLFGTDAGLLFRVREEIYGLIEGYEKVFWTDHAGHRSRAADRLSVQCEVTEAAFKPKSKKVA